MREHNIPPSLQDLTYTLFQEEKKKKRGKQSFKYLNVKKARNPVCDTQIIASQPQEVAVFVIGRLTEHLILKTCHCSAVHFLSQLVVSLLGLFIGKSTEKKLYLLHS